MTGSNPNVQTGECSTAVNGYSIKILGDATTTAPQGDATNSNDCSSSSEYCDPAPCQGTVSCGGPTTTTVTNSASHATIGTIAVLVGLVANLIA